VLQLTSPEAVIYCGDGVARLDAWKRRASAFLLLHIGEPPEPEQQFAN
jgi:hypothetical protein